MKQPNKGDYEGFDGLLVRKDDYIKDLESYIIYLRVKNANLTGRMEGHLLGILTWNLPSKLKNKIKKILDELESSEV